MVIRQVEKRTNQPQEKHVRNGTVKAVIDLFGILINQDFFISLVDVNKEKDISVLAGVPFPTPRASGLFLSPYCQFIGHASLRK